MDLPYLIGAQGCASVPSCYNSRDDGLLWPKYGYKEVEFIGEGNHREIAQEPPGAEYRA